MSPRPNKVFSVDEWKFEGYQEGGMIGGLVPFEAYHAHVIETFRRNVTLFSGDRLPHHIELGSDSFFAPWETREECTDYFGNPARLGGPIALAYIDGDHTYAHQRKISTMLIAILSQAASSSSMIARMATNGWFPIVQPKRPPHCRAMK
jgi:hypothetical protein